jgi:hypothetical protein
MKDEKKSRTQGRKAAKKEKNEGRGSGRLPALLALFFLVFLCGFAPLREVSSAFLSPREEGG